MKSRLSSREIEGLPCRILGEEKFLFMSFSLYCIVLFLFCMSTDMAFHLEARLGILRIIRNQEILNPHCC